MTFNGRKGNGLLEELPEQKFNCALHGGYSGKPVRFAWGEHEIMEPPCPKCEEERTAKEKEREEKQKAALEARGGCEEKARQVKEFKKMNIGKKFWGESFDTFDPYTEELKRYFDICVSFAGNHQGRMLVMIGNHGNGKDHLAASALKKIGGYMYSVFEIELLLKRSYAGKISEWAIYQRLCNAPLLVINEIGRHKTGEWELNFLSHIVNKRYQNMMPIIFVSNKHLIDNCKCGDCLQNYIGNDIVSRIIEGGEIMIFTGEDYRYKKRELREALLKEGKNG